jgi:phosphate starvation-inducible membrane PsiE
MKYFGGITNTSNLIECLITFILTHFVGYSKLFKFINLFFLEMKQTSYKLIEDIPILVIFFRPYILRK